MNLQFLVDGLLSGSMVGLGAIGITLTYSILRFSNFAHGDFMAWGTYATLTLVGLIGAVFGATAPLGPLSFGWPLIVAGLAGMVLTGLMALALDAVLCVGGSWLVGKGAPDPAAIEARARAAAALRG